MSHVTCVLPRHSRNLTIAPVLRTVASAALRDACLRQTLAKDQFAAQIRLIGLSLHGALAGKSAASRCRNNQAGCNPSIRGITFLNSPHKLLEKLYGQQRQPPTADIAPLLRRYAEPLPEPDSPAFADMFDRYADARVVMIGEASHGTSDFYRTRAAITQRLIERHGFNIVAVEADWPDAGHVDGPGRPASGP